MDNMGKVFEKDIEAETEIVSMPNEMPICKNFAQANTK
jgi:hypothetical protein